MRRSRTAAKIASTREAILVYFAERKTPCRPHPAMLYQDLAVLVKEGKLEKEIRHLENRGLGSGVEYPKTTRFAYYQLSEKERAERTAKND
jgi:hypothetical protein